MTAPVDKYKDYVTYDIECYKNYFLIMFRKLSGGDPVYYEMFNDSPLNINGIKHMLNKYTMVSFNGLGYDRQIVAAALNGLTNQQIHNVSNYIIQGDNTRPWQVLTQFGITSFEYDEIDLIEVAPLSASLKIYAGRLHVHEMQDLPIEPQQEIIESDLVGMRRYCNNDNIDTALLFHNLTDQIDLRILMSEQYKVDVRSKSDAQVAEAVYKAELADKYGIKVRKAIIDRKSTLKYTTPDFVSFKTPLLKRVLADVEALEFTIQKSGHVKMPPILTDGHLVIGNSVCEIPINKKPELNKWDLEIVKEGAIYRAKTLAGTYIQESSDSLVISFRSKNIKSGKITNKRFKKIDSNKIHINESVYTFGLGGLHSTESNRHIDSRGEDYVLKDYDVVSYYPFIILVLGLFPPAIGAKFLVIFKSIVMRRLKAKAEGRKTDAGTLKILINGTFGKLGSMFSFLYAPQLMLQVTITGQLCLLMLIEELELAGVPVVSANTDGVVLRIHEGKQAAVDTCVMDWELETGFDMESTEYKGVYSQGVNSYIAHTSYDDFKYKGAFAKPSLSLNPQNEICVDAVCAYIKNGTPLIDTIRACTDVRKFVTVRKVTGGATYEGEYVGKAIRWYYSDESLSAIHYKKSGNKVPKSDGSRPLMALPADNKTPSDLDFNWYVTESIAILDSIDLLAF